MNRIKHKKVINIYLPQEILEQLENYCIEHGKVKSRVIGKCLLDFLRAECPDWNADFSVIEAKINKRYRDSHQS